MLPYVTLAFIIGDFYDMTWDRRGYETRSDASRRPLRRPDVASQPRQPRTAEAEAAEAAEAVEAVEAAEAAEAEATTVAAAAATTTAPLRRSASDPSTTTFGSEMTRREREHEMTSILHRLRRHHRGDDRQNVEQQEGISPPPSTAVSDIIAGIRDVLSSPVVTAAIRGDGIAFGGCALSTKCLRCRARRRGAFHP